MSALRYSGNVRIRVTYHDRDGRMYADGTLIHPNGFYRCALVAFDAHDKEATHPEGRCIVARASVIVGAPAFLSHAVDSPEAFTEAASAALSFADDVTREWSERAAYAPDGSGWHVGTSPTRAWPTEPKGEVSILSIDAWNGPEGWTWNAWYKRGTCDVTLCDRSHREILSYMRREGYLSDGSKGRVTIEDDQYNLVILDKGTREPLFAIAYGEVQS